MPVDLYGGPTHKPCHLLFSGPTHRLCQVLFSWPMWAFTKAKVKLHMGFHIYTVYMLLNYVCLKRRLISFCSSALCCQRHFQSCSLVIGFIDPTWHTRIQVGIVGVSSKSTAIIPHQSSMDIALILRKMLARFSLALHSFSCGVVDTTSFAIGQFWILHWVS